MKNLSPTQIIFTLVFGIFLFTLFALLVPSNLLQGGKIAVLDFEGFIIEITDANYDENIITFSYTIEALEPIEVSIEPIIQPNLHIQKERKVHDRTIGNFINAYTEYYVIKDDVVPSSITLSFEVLGKQTRSINLSQQ